MVIISNVIRTGVGDVRIGYCRRWNIIDSMGFPVEGKSLKRAVRRLFTSGMMNVSDGGTVGVGVRVIDLRLRLR